VTESDDRAHALDGFRSYLHMLGRLQLSGAFPGKLDLSGVVQQTLLEAHAAGDRFPWGRPDEQAAWLRRAFGCNLTDELRKLGTAARDVGREQSLEAALEESAARVETWLAADHSSPSQRAERCEQLLRLAAALEGLPEDQRTAVELHHLQGMSLAETGGRMGRSKEAVAGLLFRGLKRLRDLLGADWQ
jgi:RNA polymerase sigma-70 factor (ECF subfamily)